MYRNVLIGMLIISAALLCALVSYTAKRRNIPGILWFTLLMTAMIIHTIGYVFELQSENLRSILACINFEYVGSAFYPSLTLLFASRYTDEHKFANRYVISIFAALDVITLLLVWTNSYHGLYYSALSVVNTPGFPVLAISKGLWYYVHAVTVYIAIFYFIINIIVKIRHSSNFYKKKLTISLIGVMIPFVSTLIYLFGPLNIDLAPIAYFYMSIVIAYGVMHYDLLLISPVTYETIFNSIEEAVMVTDEKGLLLQFNNASKSFFPSLENAKMGDMVYNINELLGCDLSPGNHICQVGGRIYSFTINKIKNNAAIFVAGDITESERAKIQLSELAARDSLTGIHNRRWFCQEIDKFSTGIFAILDLDYFKSLNDTYGHAEGDFVLRAFGQALESAFAGKPTCRYGGEEFALFIPDGELTGVYNMIEEFRERFSKTNLSYKVTFSAGMAVYSSENSVESILTADRKLYEAKEHGRNLTLY